MRQFIDTDSFGIIQGQTFQKVHRDFFFFFSVLFFLPGAPIVPAVQVPHPSPPQGALGVGH